MASQQDNQHLQGDSQTIISASFHNAIDKEIGLNNHKCLTLYIWIIEKQKWRCGTAGCRDGHMRTPPWRIICISSKTNCEKYNSLLYNIRVHFLLCVSFKSVRQILACNYWLHKIWSGENWTFNPNLGGGILPLLLIFS